MSDNAAAAIIAVMVNKVRQITMALPVCGFERGFLMWEVDKARFYLLSFFGFLLPTQPQSTAVFGEGSFRTSVEGSTTGVGAGVGFWINPDVPR